MLGNCIKCCTKQISSTAFDFNKHNLWIFKTGFAGPQRQYSDRNKCGCGKEVPQEEGRAVAKWPKDDDKPPQAWRCSCPREPMPFNNDPYRIKVPEIVVPPLPPANAKSMGFSLYQNPNEHPYVSGWTNPRQGQQYGQGQQYEHHEQQCESECQPTEQQEEGIFAKIKKWLQSKTGGDNPQLDCSRKGTCAPPAPPPPPCPPPPVKPFPWIIVFATTAILAALGGLFKYWVYNETLKKLAKFNIVWQPRKKSRRPIDEIDLPDCVQYLIIGAGAAGFAAYNAIMQNDAKAKVFIVTKEDITMPYLKSPMSKHMWWNKLPPDIKTLRYFEDKYKTMYLTACDHFMDVKKFDRMPVGPAAALASGWCVVRIDADNHIAYIKTFVGEKPVYYERCLLAVGSDATQLYIFKIAPKLVRDKSITLNSIRDFEIAFRRVREAKHVTIIGADILGCELAWYIAKMKEKIEKDEHDESPPLQITLMYKDAGVLGDLLPEYLGEWAAEKLKCEGVQIMPKTVPHDAFLSKDNRLQLTLNNGSSLVTDFAIVCTGTEPNVDIAHSSYLEVDDVNGGYLVNTELEARKHLYAAGDVASFYSQLKRTRQRMPYQDPSVEQGTLAGYNMTGYWDPCIVENHYWLKLEGGIQMEIVGDVGACMPTIALFKPCRAEDLPPEDVEADAKLPCYKDAAEYKERYKRGMICYIRDETIVGFIFWNMPPIADRKGVATEILRAQPSYKDINMVADLLGFEKTECHIDKELLSEQKQVCITAYREF